MTPTGLSPLQSRLAEIAGVLLGCGVVALIYVLAEVLADAGVMQ